MQQRIATAWAGLMVVLFLDALLTGQVLADIVIAGVMTVFATVLFHKAPN